MDSLKVAHFTISATMEQSIRWKQVAEAAGHPVASWLALAADAYLKATTSNPTPTPANPPPPVPRRWHKGRFRVVLVGGNEVEVEGMTAHPFGYFTGSATGPRDFAGRILVHLPTRRMIASARTTRQIRDMAAELEPAYVRGEGVPNHREQGSTALADEVGAYLGKARLDSGRPVPLAWRKGQMCPRLPDGSAPELWGWVSPPFGFFHGDSEGPRIGRGGSYALVLLTTGRVLATLRSARQCRALAEELAQEWVRSDGAGKELPGNGREPPREETGADHATA
jgi:hypothetical protein